VVCPAFAHLGGALTPVNVLTLKLMRHMQRSPYTHVKSLQVSPALHTDIERVMLGYITFLLERRLESVDFIRRIRA
jgi:DNA repair protein RecO (recombination protein O)